MAYSAYQYSGGILYPEHASQIVIDSSADLADINLDVVAPGTRVVDCSSGSMYILSPGKEWKLIQNNVAAASKSVVTESASGDIAVISDGADDVAVKSLVAEITPVQDLHGQSNPYPPGGGVNKLNLAECTPANKAYGLTITISGDEVVLSGTYTGTNASARFRLFQYSDSRVISYNAKGFAADSATSLNFAGDLYKADNDTAITVSLINMVQNTAYTLRIKPVLYEGSTAPTAWSPYSNIRPISGRTGLTVMAAGKNLGELVEGTAVSQQYSTVTYKEGGVSVVSTAAYGRIGFSIPVVIGQHYTVSFKCKRVGEPYSIQFNNVASFGYAYKVYTAIEMPTDSFSKKSFSFVANTDVLFVGVYPQAVDTGIYIEEFQIETGDTATPYTPYVAPDTYPVSWQTEAGTVYGGTLDVVSGVLTVTHGYILLDGTQPSTKRNGRSAIAQRAFISIDGKAVGIANMQSDRFFVTHSSDVVGKMVGRAENNGIEFSLPLDGTANTDESCKQWFADNNTQLVYELATPQTYQLTPTEVRTLLGGNTIYTDAGAVSVEYIADTKLYIDNKVAELQALILEN